MEQFQTLSQVIPRLAQNSCPTRRIKIGGDTGEALNYALRAAHTTPAGSRIGYAPDLCQVNSLARANDEIAADCWALTLDGATTPDPRPWVDILASGDHKRIVKAERVAFLDWEKPGKEGKPVRRAWKAPQASAPHSAPPAPDTRHSPSLSTSRPVSKSAKPRHTAATV